MQFQLGLGIVLFIASCAARDLPLHAGTVAYGNILALLNVAIHPHEHAKKLLHICILYLYINAETVNDFETVFPRVIRSSRDARSVSQQQNHDV